MHFTQLCLYYCRVKASQASERSLVYFFNEGTLPIQKQPDCSSKIADEVIDYSFSIGKCFYVQNGQNIHYSW